MYWLTKLARNKKLLTIVAVVICGLLLTPALSSAQDDPYGLTGENSISKGLEDDAGNNVLGDADLPEVIGRIINVALGLLGTVAVVVILIGGFKWMTAGGNDDQVAEARKWIFSGIIGLGIIMSAWAITRFVFRSLNTAINPDSELIL